MSFSFTIILEAAAELNDTILRGVSPTFTYSSTINTSFFLFIFIIPEIAAFEFHKKTTVTFSQQFQ